MVLLLVLSFGALASLYLLLPVAPLYVAAGGGGDVGAGAATGVMMLATVLAEPVVPGLLNRWGYRAGMVLGLILLGGGSVAMAASPALALVLATCAARPACAFPRCSWRRPEWPGGRCCATRTRWWAGRHCSAPGSAPRRTGRWR